MNSESSKTISILFEGVETHGEAHPYGAVPTIGAFVPDISQLSESIKDIADAIVATIRPQKGGPETLEVEFGIKVSAEGKIIVAKASGETHLKVHIRWGRED